MGIRVETLNIAYLDARTFSVARNWHTERDVHDKGFETDHVGGFGLYAAVCFYHGVCHDKYNLRANVCGLQIR